MDHWRRDGYANTSWLSHCKWIAANYLWLYKIKNKREEEILNRDAFSHTRRQAKTCDLFECNFNMWSYCLAGEKLVSQQRRGSLCLNIITVEGKVLCVFCVWEWVQSELWGLPCHVLLLFCVVTDAKQAAVHFSSSWGLYGHVLCVREVLVVIMWWILK